MRSPARLVMGILIITGLLVGGTRGRLLAGTAGMLIGGFLGALLGWLAGWWVRRHFLGSFS